MKYKINGIDYSKKQLENIISGTVKTYFGENGSVPELVTAALEALESIEEGRSFVPLTFEEAMTNSKVNEVNQVEENEAPVLGEGGLYITEEEE